MKSSVATACLLLAASSASAQDAESAPTLREITVSTPRGAARPFDVPGSVDRVEGNEMRDARLQVNLSESLGSVPGLQIQNRQNYAQDLQLSIRGFGARSTFGVRGVRLYVDGIPATLPDGQGQTSNIDIGSADRVEILRGPFSALYGNSSGGVVQVFTEDGQGPPLLGFSLAGGSFGTARVGSKLSGSSGAIDYLLSASRFHTDGWREHSAADREIQNGKLGFRLDDGSKLTLVFNSVHLYAQDPLGLSASQYALNPRGVDPVATQFDTRKTVDQQQLGLSYERRIDAANTLRLIVYGGQRSTVQFQAIPTFVQQNPLHAGGVIDLARDYGGVDLRWSARLQLADRPFDLVAGLAYDGLRERRRGWENFVGRSSAPLALGVLGRLRRNERNEVRNLDPYVQGSWRFADRWTLEAGVRRSNVRFSSHDLHVVGPNRDDSGSARYRKTLPVASLRYEATPDLALYASVGRGFETPTLNELSYRADGFGGLNFALQPSVNSSVEVGAKARLGGGLLTAALFQTRTRDEIVTNTNFGGRATFRTPAAPSATASSSPGSTRRRTIGARSSPTPGSMRATATASARRRLAARSARCRRATASLGSRSMRFSRPSAGCRPKAGAPVPSCAHLGASRPTTATTLQHPATRWWRSMRATSSAGSVGSSTPSRAWTTSSTGATSAR